jgi:hypothetical protein
MAFRLWRIAIDRSGHVGAITQLTPSQPLNGADGFRLIRDNGFLLAENAHFIDCNVCVVGYLSNVIKRKLRRNIASKSRIARPFGQAAKLNDSFPSSAARAVHTAYTPPPWPHTS